MEDKKGLCGVTEENEVEVGAGQDKPPTQGNAPPRWANGQCVLAVQSSSMLNPSFDLSFCRSLLERDGFQIPVGDFEAPLATALDAPSVRRFIVFNTSLFHFILAPVMYVVIWCAVFSTLHLYMAITDYWLLCLSVSLIAIFLTTGVIFVLHHSNKEINMNIDVRLIQVNERMVKHKLLVGVADWVQNCTGALQLFCVYWDMSSCLQTLTETFEKSFLANDAQEKLQKRLSHLVLVSEVKAPDPEAGGCSTGEASGEERPLLGHEETERSTPSGRREDAKITSSHTLIPDPALPAQVKAHQLLVTYSAAYVKLLMSENLSGPSRHELLPRRNHCSSASLCLCQYIKAKVLR